MRKIIAAALVALTCPLPAAAQPGRNADFTLYERNPTLFLLLVVAAVAAAVVVALFLLRKRK